MAIDTEERTDGAPASSTGAPAATSTGKKSGGNRNKKILIIVGVIVAALIVLGIVGSLAVGYFWNKAAETGLSAVTGGKVKLDTKDGEFSYGDDGDSYNVKTGPQTELPDDYPKDAVPLYRGAKLVSATDMSIGDEGTIFSLAATTPDSTKDVIGFYKQTLSKDKGWKVSYSSNTAETSSMIFRNESKNMTTNVTVSSDEEEALTNVSLSVTLKMDS